MDTPHPDRPVETQRQTAASNPPVNPCPENRRHPDAHEPRELTPEEQMAQYEAALKETDWGHQPC
jgi:hypothetical protein